MIRKSENSRIEIWAPEYINTIEKRHDEDKNVNIIQIEHGANGKDYIVEIVDKE